MLMGNVYEIVHLKRASVIQTSQEYKRNESNFKYIFARILPKTIDRAFLAGAGFLDMTCVRAHKYRWILGLIAYVQ